MSRAYTRFLILSSPRCGTHMLRSALAEHPQLVCFTEAFNPDFVHDGPYDETTHEDTILDEHLFSDYPPGVRAVGFPLHRSGARFGRWPTLWQRLERDESLRVISLSRLHLLGRYVSYRIMREREDRDTPRLFTREELQAEFRLQETAVKVFDERFAGHPLLPVKYEQLVDDWDTWIGTIQEFLGVDPLPLKPGTKPNKGVPYRRLVENHDELAQHFAETPWGWLFRGTDKSA